MLHILPATCVSRAAALGAPSLVSVSNTEERAIACGQSWRRNVGWTLDFFNDAAYEIQIYDDVTSFVVASGLLTSSSPYVHDTGATGDTAFSGNTHETQYTVRVIRKSDSAVVDSMQTTLESVVTGPAC